MRIARRLGPLVLLLAAGLSTAQAAPGCPPELRIAFLDTDLRPYINGPHARFAEPPGFLVDWTKQALRRLGCKAELLRLPQRRLLTDLALGEVQLAPGIGHNAERLTQYAFPLRADGSVEPRLSIGEARLSLFVRKDRRDRVRWDGQLLDVEPNRIGVVARGVEEPLALAKGWNVETSLNHARNAEKLRRGRLNVVLMPHLALSAGELARAPGLVELQPPVLRTHFYAPANPRFAAEHERFTKSFWLELCRASRGHFKDMPSCG